MQKLIKLSTFLSLLLFFNVSFGQETGLCNIFSDEFDGSWTASNERYQKNELTAAHKSYEFGTILNVARIDDGARIQVKVIDRGPFISGYVLTLSRKAANELGINDDKTRITISVAKDDKLVGRKKTVTNIETGEKHIVSTSTKKKAPVETVQTREFVSKGSSSMQKLTHANYRQHGLYKVDIYKPNRSGYALQVGTFTSYQNAMREMARLQGKKLENVLMSMEQAKDGKSTAYKILIGPFPSKESANSFNSSTLKPKKIQSFIVDLEKIQY